MPDPTTPIKRLEQRDQSGIHVGVDTVALKKRIEANSNLSKDYDRTVQDMKEKGRGGKEVQKYLSERGKELGDLASAQYDSLTVERNKGKKKP